jgi:hypothetical protein
VRVEVGHDVILAINGESARHYQCHPGTISATPFLGPPPPFLASTKSDRIAAEIRVIAETLKFALPRTAADMERAMELEPLQAGSQTPQQLARAAARAERLTRAPDAAGRNAKRDFATGLDARLADGGGPTHYDLTGFYDGVTNPYQSSPT